MHYRPLRLRHLRFSFRWIDIAMKRENFIGLSFDTSKEARLREVWRSKWQDKACHLFRDPYNLENALVNIPLNTMRRNYYYISFLLQIVYYLQPPKYILQMEQILCINIFELHMINILQVLLLNLYPQMRVYLQLKFGGSEC